MTGPGPAPATFYRPAQVAQMLQCSEWWVKEQARHRRIPYSWIGGSYLFTEQHIAEIVRLFEVRPNADTAAAPTGTVLSGRAARRLTDCGSEPAIRLSARVPRRARAAATGEAA
jgi:hypothetical protein